MAEEVREFLTVNELAERWRCNIRKIYYGEKPEGFPKAIRIFGTEKNKKILFRLSDVIEYEKSREGL